MSDLNTISNEKPMGGCFLPGNVIFSCQIDIPASPAVTQPTEDFMQGYSKKPVHPMYKTTTQDYGQQKPDVHSMPNVFHCKSQKFSNHLGVCGMYKNSSLNTALEQKRV